MNKILIASIAVLGFAGVAAAQEAPALYGNNYDAAVTSSFGPQASVAVGSHSVSGQQNITAPAADTDYNINLSGNYSGK